MLSTSSRNKTDQKSNWHVTKTSVTIRRFHNHVSGGSLLYSKIYKGFKEKGGDSGIQMQQPHPMTFAALFYAIQTPANELYTENANAFTAFLPRR